MLTNDELKLAIQNKQAQINRHMVDIVKDMGISIRTYYTFMSKGKISRLSRIKIEEWLAK